MRWESQHLMLSHKIRTLIVPVPIRWLHLQFWFLLWSLLLDWRRFMAARKIKMAVYNLGVIIQSIHCFWCILFYLNWEGRFLPLLPQSLLLLRTQAPTQSVKDKLAVGWLDYIFYCSLLNNGTKQTEIVSLFCVKNQQSEWHKNCERENWHNRLHTCGESCCVCVGGGGDDGEVWSGGLSRSGMRSWRSRSPFSAPWSSAGHGDRTGYRASRAVSHPPLRQVGDTSSQDLLQHIHCQTRLYVCKVHTFLLPSSLRSKAHCCLHCSQVCGGPYFFSELVQRWHFVPIKAAMMLQYWQGLGCKTDKRPTTWL